MKRFLPFAIIAGTLAVALIAAWYWKGSNERHYQPSPNTLNEKSRNTPAKPGAEPVHALGNTDAPVMIEEFGDFECASCGLLHPILKTMNMEFGPRLVIVFREFPLASIHPHAVEAARAAEAAGLQGKFWEMHDLLYETQNAWHEESDVGPTFERYAANLGLDLDRFRRDLNSEVVNRRLLLDKERAIWIGVNSTPTVFLNGREVPFESLTPDKLRVLIKAQP